MQYYIRATGGTQEQHEKLMSALRGYLAATDAQYVRGMARWLESPTWDMKEPEPERYETKEELWARVLAR